MRSRNNMFSGEYEGQMQRSNTVDEMEDHTMRIRGPFNTAARIRKDKKKSDGVMMIIDEIKTRKDRGLGVDQSLYLTRRYN